MPELDQMAATALLSRGRLPLEERRRLFLAALEDQQLFDELMEDEGVREVLIEPGTRARALEELAKRRRRSWFAGVSLATAAALVMAVWVSQRGAAPPFERLAIRAARAALDWTVAESAFQAKGMSAPSVSVAAAGGPVRVGEPITIQVHVPSSASVLLLVRRQGAEAVLLPVAGESEPILGAGAHEVTDPQGRRPLAPAVPGRYEVRLISVPVESAPRSTVRDALAEGRAVVTETTFEVLPREKP